MRSLSQLARSLVSAYHRRLGERGKTPQKFYIEVGMTAGLLLAAMLLSTTLTPYDPKLEITDRPTTNTDVQARYYRAQIAAIDGRDVRVTLLDGPRKGTSTTVEYPGSLIDSRENRNIAKYTPGALVLVSNTTQDSSLFLIDHYRIPLLLGLFLVFIALVLLVGGRQGFGSVVGLGVTVIVIGWFVIPFILDGHNPLLICITGAYIIALASIAIAHGFKRRTFLSVACVAIVLGLVALLSQVAVMLMNFSGVSEEATAFFVNDNPSIDMRGIVTGGIIIATLGVLDDIVTAQVATVDELKKANVSLGIRELFLRASSVGREHISALVNTLALVYVGAALPTVVATAAYVNNVIFINNEYIATEVTRTLVASIGLVLAVPISTLFAAIYLHRHYSKQA